MSLPLLRCAILVPLPCYKAMLQSHALFRLFLRLTSCDDSASSLGMMSDEEKKMQRIEDIKELLS